MSNWEIIPPQRLQLFIELFRRVGYRSPSMLDIANHLSISKKTLYTYVPNKEQLILHCLAEQEKDYQVKYALLLEKKLSEKDDLWELFTLKWQFYQEFSHHAEQDLSLHYPEAFTKYKVFEDDVCEMLRQHFRKYNDGSRQGFTPNFLAELVCSQIKAIAHKQFILGEQSQQSLLADFFNYHWHATH